MFLITKHTAKGKVDAYVVTQDDVLAFNNDDTVDPALSGWTIENQHDLSTAPLGTKELLALYNQTRPDNPLVKFQDRGQAVERTFAALKTIARPFDLVKPKRAARTPAAKPATSSKPKADAGATAARKRGEINLDPMSKAYACRDGSIQAGMVDLLARKSGATLDDLRTVCKKKDGAAWSDSSIKSALHWDVRKVKGYGIRTEMKGDKAHYHLVLPKGLSAPVPHKAAGASKDA